MSDTQTVRPNSQTPAAPKTAPSGGPDGANTASTRHPKQTRPRPWLTIQPGRDGRRHVGVDGLTVEDMIWIFDTQTGALRIGQVPWKAPRITGAVHPIVGGFGKPTATGPCVEVTRGAPGFAWPDACLIYDECEKSGEPVKNAVLRRMDPETTTQEQKRSVIQAPNIYVMPDREFTPQRRDNAALDDQIAKVLAAKKVG